MEVCVAVVCFFIGFFVAYNFGCKSKTPRWLKRMSIDNENLPIKKAHRQNDRAMQVRDHTMRLNEVAFLISKLQAYDNDTEVINTFIERIEVTIDKLTDAISGENDAWAGSLLKTFSRHLREVLNEAATNRIEFRTCTTHVEHLLSLLSSLNKNTWGFEINDHQVFELDRPRFVKSLAIMPWIADLLWESVINNVNIDYVGVEIASDTYEATYTITFDGNKMIRSTPLIDGEVRSED